MKFNFSHRLKCHPRLYIRVIHVLWVKLQSSSVQKCSLLILFLLVIRIQLPIFVEIGVSTASWTLHLWLKVFNLTPR